VSVAGPDDRVAEGSFRSPFTEEEIDRALAWMEDGTTDSVGARNFGERLFRSLFQGAVAGIYVASQDSTDPLRIRLTIDDPSVARLPWELLVDPANGGALALRGRFVRGIATEGGARKLTAEPPLRVLVADSSPHDLPKLEAQLEARDVAGALQPIVSIGRLEVVTLQNATLSTLLNALREGSTANPPRPFHVLHWIGHGGIDFMTGANVLVFETDEGTSDPVDGTRLADLVHASDVRLVLLNACQSAAPTPAFAPTPTAEITRGIAEVLLTSGIPAVIGMRVDVVDETARRFAREFYQAIADGRTIDEAVLDARVLVAGRMHGEAADLGIPILYLRSGTGQLIASAETLSWWGRQKARYKRLSPIARVAMFVIAAVATLAIEQSAQMIYHSVQGPARMTSDYNVVVTEFDARDPAGRAVHSDAASDLSQRLATALSKDVETVGPGLIEVRSPEQAGRLAGSTPEERAREARRLADQINADVVVYGWLDESRTTLQPEFYVRDRVLQDAQELVGSFRLGSAIREAAAIDVEKAAGIELRETLVSRAKALSELVFGLSYFRLGRFSDAAQHFDVALDAPGWPDSDGKEILYLFRGSSAGALGDLAAARQWFDRALAINPAFARARLGLAEVGFQEAKGRCERGEVDSQALLAARGAYQDVLAATDQPASANVAAKAHLGIARVDVCISQAELENRWEEAATEAGIVVSKFEAGDDSLRELASEAHGVIAISSLPVTGDPNAAAHYGDAEAEFRKAITLGSRPDRLAAFHAGLADVLGKLDRVDEARREYDVAIQLGTDQDRRRYQELRLLLDPTPKPSAIGSPAVSERTHGLVGTVVM
jgi:tetratricopeptide (TPR) repeat protein